MKKISRFKALAVSVILGAVTGVFRGAGEGGKPSVLYYILFTLSAALIGGFAYLAGSSPSPKQQKLSDGFKTAVVIAAFGTAASAFFSFNVRAALAAEPMDMLSPACLALAVIAAAAMIFSVASKDAETSSVMLSVPVFYAGALLLFFYKEHAAANPHVYAYAAEIIAAAMAAMAIQSVSIMKFGGKGKSPLITFSFLGAAAAAASLVSGAVTGGGYLPLPRLCALLCLVIYAAAWYLFPPAAYVKKKEALSGDEAASGQPSAKDSFFDMETAEPVIPDADAIIDEIKSDNTPIDIDDPEL